MKKQRGITLIALVITIVVLVILVGVTISLVVGDNGILAQATQSVEANEIATEKEQIEMSYAGLKTDVIRGKKNTVTAENLEKAMNDAYGENTVKVVVPRENYLKVTYTKSHREYEISNDGKILPIGGSNPGDNPGNDSGDNPGNSEDVTLTDATGEWTFIAHPNGEATIISYKGPDKEVVIPNTLDGYKVTSLGVGHYQFADLIGVRSGGNMWSIDISNEYRGHYGTAYYQQEDITKVIISEGIENINNHAFRDSKALKEVVLPSTLKSIGDNAFDNCPKLNNITIGNSVKSIGDQAFQGCSSLSNITIPRSVKKMGFMVFAYCDTLTVKIPDEFYSDSTLEWDEEWDSSCNITIVYY